MDSALELGQSERRRLLEEVGAGSPELRREVESLLDCEGQADGFLAAPALAFSADFFAEGEGADERAGQSIGHYRVIREIGRGGMGAVYLGERADGEFQQQVALKVVRRSFADSELARRFRRERQILASLNHPNIARLLDGGMSAGGEPYIVMEYVEGARLDDYCNAKNLSTAGRLRLFLGVCRGVSYAHQHLVVHRDIKPSNILVTADGTPKLLDFGIAKLLGPTQGGDEHTRTEMRAFTPDYASPEQVSGGQITTASDVYSLGVLLRDLLAGSRLSADARKAPGRWRSETPGPKIITTNVPTEPEGDDGKAQAAVRKFAGAELENIIAMARREDPARRYSSAAQLAEDVQRYLDGLPVRAQKDSFAYRARKFVRRNKVAVGAALLVALSLVAGLAAALWQAGVARSERDRAERRFADVRRLSNAFLFEIAPKIERLEGSTEAREALVTSALQYLDSLARESGDDPQLQSELAAAYEKVGDLQGAPRRANLGDFSGAIASYEKARDVRRRLLEKSPGDFEQRRRLAAVLAALGYVRWWTSDVSGSLADSARALEIYERLDAERPGSSELRVAASEALLDLATTHFFNEQLAEAHPLVLKALASLEALARDEPANVEAERLLSRGYTLQGSILFWNTKEKEADAEMTKAIALSESLAAGHPHDGVLKQSLLANYLQASQIYQKGDPARSVAILTKALRVAEESVAADAANTQARQNLAKTYSMLGLIALHMEKPGVAAPHLARSAAEFEELERVQPKNRTYKHDIARVSTYLGLAKYQQRDFEAALAGYRKAVALYEDDLRADPKNMMPFRKLASVHTYIGDALRDSAKTATGDARRSRLRAAKESHQRALDAYLTLQARNALTKLDRRDLEVVQAALRQYEQ
ncbi:MAG TPA: protein kinase [Pyrinomonadaceae bacterium]|nr:protein kinase [Pyrinomonadaceae bacterium]